MIPTLVIAGVSILALVVAWVLWRRPWAGPRTRHPLVLAHGLFGFDEIQVAGLKHEYFSGMTDHLKTLKVGAHNPAVPPVGSVEKRARALADAVRTFGHRKVNIVAHSMGGLDARYAITKLGLHKYVASLTTIGTPHRGTPVADLAATVLGKSLGLTVLWKQLGVEAPFDLTTDQTAAFNASVPDHPRVRYFSVVGTTPAGGAGMPGILRPVSTYLDRKGSPHDGLVPADSQRWGKELWELQSSHFEQIGWSSEFDALQFIEQLAQRLRKRGL